MSLKILPPALTRLLLDGEEDILTPLVEKERFTRSLMSCQRCGGAYEKILDSNRSFSPDRPLPRFFYRCEGCKQVYDPETGIVVEVGQMVDRPKERFEL